MSVGQEDRCDRVTTDGRVATIQRHFRAGRQREPRVVREDHRDVGAQPDVLVVVGLAVGVLLPAVVERVLGGQFVKPCLYCDFHENNPSSGESGTDKYYILNASYVNYRILKVYETLQLERKRDSRSLK